jgi:Predicted membrane protein
MPSSWDFGGLSLREFGKSTYQQATRDDILGRSAQLAYYFLLSIFPLLLFIVTVIGLMAGPEGTFRQELLKHLETAMPPEAYSLVQSVLTQVSEGARGGAAVVSMLAALWTASVGFAAVMSGLNAAYGVEETRPWWKARLLAIGMTAAVSALVLLALGIFLFGGWIGRAGADRLGLGEVFSTLWNILHWPLMLFFVLLALALVYRFGPDLQAAKWAWITPGAVAALAVWLLSSAGLRIYLANFGNYGAVYGSLGAVIILLLWFYLSGLAILIGAEVNAVIEDAAARSGKPDVHRRGERHPQRTSETPAPELEEEHQRQ